MPSSAGTGTSRCPPSVLTKRDYVARALRGGYPEAVRRDPGRRRARFFDSYVTDLVSRTSSRYPTSNALRRCAAC
jgi:hypothetical protein